MYEENEGLNDEPRTLDLDLPEDHDDFSDLDLEPLDEFDNEYDLDFGYEHDSAMRDAGFGTDEDYGYFGGEDY